MSPVLFAICTLSLFLLTDDSMKNNCNLPCLSMWTQECIRYLMAGYHDHKHNAINEYVDKDSKGVPGGQAKTHL